MSPVFSRYAGSASSTKILSIIGSNKVRRTMKIGSLTRGSLRLPIGLTLARLPKALPPSLRQVRAYTRYCTCGTMLVAALPGLQVIDLASPNSFATKFACLSSCENLSERIAQTINSDSGDNPMLRRSPDNEDSGGYLSLLQKMQQIFRSPNSVTRLNAHG